LTYSAKERLCAMLIPPNDGLTKLVTAMFRL
jgi:hypothetical protein